MKLYYVETANGNYANCLYHLAMKACATAIAAHNSPYAFMYDSETGELVNEFFHSSIKIDRKL